MKIMVAALAVVGVVMVLLLKKAESDELFKVTDKVRYKEFFRLYLLMLLLRCNNRTILWHCLCKD